MADDTVSISGRSMRTNAVALRNGDGGGGGDAIEDTIAALAADSKYVQQLFRKIQRSLSSRGAYGIVDISDSFRRLDRTVTREAAEAREAMARARRYGGGGGGGVGGDDSYGGSGGGSSMSHHHVVTRGIVDPTRADRAVFCRYIHGGLAMEGVTLREVEVLFALLADGGGDWGDMYAYGGGDGGGGGGGGYTVDMADALLAIRKLFRCTAQQFHEVLRKIRSKRPPLFYGDDGGNGRRSNNGGGAGGPPNPFRRRSGAVPSRPPSREVVYDYLMNGGGLNGPFGLTESEAFLFLDYCSVQEKDAAASVEGGGGGGFGADASGLPRAGSGSPNPNNNSHSESPPRRPVGMLDVGYVETVIFSSTLPDDVAFPLVMAKFIEAATDPLKGDGSGTAGILRALRQCPLLPNPKRERRRRGSRRGGVAAAGLPSRRTAEDEANGSSLWGGGGVGGGSGATPRHMPPPIAGAGRSPPRHYARFGDDGDEGNRRSGGGNPNLNHSHHNSGLGMRGDSPEARRGQYGVTPQRNTNDNGNGYGSDGYHSSASSSSEDDYETAVMGGNGNSKRHTKGDSVMDMCLDAAGFRKFIHVFSGGLPVGECDLLFGYLCDRAAHLPQPLLSTEALVNHFQQRLDVWAAVDMRLALDEMRRSVDLLSLHALLAGQFGPHAETPLENVIAALRRCGLSPSAVADVEIEHVYREARTAAALVLLIRGPMPRPREEAVRRLFSRLDGSADGSSAEGADGVGFSGGGGSGAVSGELMLRAFDPSQPPNARAAASLQEKMYTFLLSMAAHASSSSPADESSISAGGGGGGGGYSHHFAVGRGRSLGATSSVSAAGGCHGGSSSIAAVRLTFAEFTYFWGCVSLLFDTDANFSLFIWRGYRMQEKEKKGWASVVPSRRDPVPLSRLVGDGGSASQNQHSSFFLGGGGGSGGGTNAGVSSRGGSIAPSMGGGGGGLYYSGSAVPYGGGAYGSSNSRRAPSAASTACSFSRGLSLYGGDYSRQTSHAGGGGGGVRRR